MTPNPRLAQIRERLEKATPGPWTWDDDYGDDDVLGMHNLCQDDSPLRVCAVVKLPDRDFIAHAPADLRYLLALVEVYEGALGRIANTELDHMPVRMLMNEALVYQDIARVTIEQGQRMGEST